MSGFDNSDLLRTRSFSVGLGIEKPISSEFSETVPVSANIENALKRLNLASVHLKPNVINDIDKKFPLANRVARTLKMHMSLDTTEGNKTFEELGMSLSKMPEVLSYIKKSLDINFSIQAAAEQLQQTKVSDLVEFVERAIVDNYLNQFLFNLGVDVSKLDVEATRFEILDNEDPTLIYTALDDQRSKFSAKNFFEEMGGTFGLSRYDLIYELTNSHEVKFSMLSDKLYQMKKNSPIY